MGDFDFRATEEGFELRLRGRLAVAHSGSEPFARAGRGEAEYRMHRGNFQVSERLDELVALRDAQVLSAGADSASVVLSRSGLYALRVDFGLEDGRLVAAFSLPGPSAAGSASSTPAPNRFRLSLPASPGDHVYGCGEQFSYLDLRGRKFPLWTSEQGVGRNKLTETTRLADADDGAGGDYYWTFYPQASFVSSAGLWYRLETEAWSEFDFSSPDRHELYAWDLPGRLVIGAAAAQAAPARAATMRELVIDQSAYFGRQGPLPGWCHEGAILGIQGGTQACLDKLERARKAGVKVAGIWAQDWEGINMTSFGQRLRWNWVWDEARYPGLDRAIPRLRAEGVRFLGYINPYVGAGMSLFNEAAKAGYLARDSKGGDYLVEFGEFYAGIVDLTNPAAFDWYKGVIKRNLIGFGLSGWMADFGEYLPTDAVLFSGESAETAHNAWPALWARCNREAVDEAVREGLAPEGEIVYFMRAGGAGSQVHCPLMWAGDQNVDWSEDDGLPSAITAALSLGMSGHGLNHSDMGGYTTLYGMKRTKELLMRWVEHSALSPFMRSHEGNRPGDNWQFDSDDATLAHLARMTRFHAALRPYLEAVVAENAACGLPAMRPLFLHHDGGEALMTCKDEYLLGEDLLCAPVLEEGATTRKLRLPSGSWQHLWSGALYEVPGTDQVSEVEIGAPPGMPPAFARSGSKWLTLFKEAVAAAEGSGKA